MKGEIVENEKLSQWYFKPGQSMDGIFEAIKELDKECLKHPLLAGKILAIITEIKKLQMINKQYEEWKSDKK